MNSLLKNIDLLNIPLLLLAGVLAYLFPLELFIFSFAILGPLHYLTEINWLNTRNYFAPTKGHVWLLIGVIASLVLVVPRLFLDYTEDHSSTISQLFLNISNWSNAVIFISLVLAIGFLYLKGKKAWLILSIITIVAAILLNQVETYILFIGVLVPTVIHVYLFTLIFMLYGAQKAKSKVGILTVIIAILIPLVYIFIDLDSSNYLFSDVLKSVYIDNKLHHTPVLFAKFFGLSDGTSFFFYEHLELRLMMFMSFIYLYHYLNWFSKTTTISWHKNLTTKRSIAIVFLWLVMLGLFYIDFKLGFLVALFFSFLHVILEFPLNMVSIKNIVAEVTNSLKGK